MNKHIKIKCLIVVYGDKRGISNKYKGMDTNRQ